MRSVCVSGCWLLSVWLAASSCAQEGAASAQDPQPKPPAAATGATGEQEPEQLTDSKTGTPSDFARFVTDGEGGHFDTAITTYRNDDGVTVRMFAAVHIADGAHYAELERRFATCGKLLYELVGPEDYRPRKGEERGGLISMLQNGMKNGLELEFQLDGVDYSADNFVHADMTPEEFADSMEERGENLFLMLWQVGMQAQASAMQRDGGEGGEEQTFDLVTAFRSGEGRHQLRLLLASQLEELEAATTGGPGSTLLEGRNEKCLQVLQEQIRKGERDLGIYYGAAHLSHMEHRLVEDMGFHKVDHEWIVAWDCTKRPDPKVDRELWRSRRYAKRDISRIARGVERWREDHDGAVPTLAQLGTADEDGKVYWSGDGKDPWGHEYVVRGFRRSPYFDVQSLGQDGVADTDDDLHSSTPRELRRMQRGEAR